MSPDTRAVCPFRQPVIASVRHSSGSSMEPRRPHAPGHERPFSIVRLPAVGAESLGTRPRALSGLGEWVRFDASQPHRQGTHVVNPEARLQQQCAEHRLGAFAGAMGDQHVEVGPCPGTIVRARRQRQIRESLDHQQTRVIVHGGTTTR